jgi:predicted TIM-barrel fold metal-dependent hydrolase
MIVDAHIHYFDSPGFLEGLIHDMDLAGVDKAVLLPTIGESTWDYVGLTFAKVDNEAVCEAVQAQPDRFVGAVRLIPTEPGAVEELRKWAATGCFRLAKFAPTEGFTVDDERITPFYEACVELDFPVLIHMGQTGGTFVGEKFAQRYQLNSALANPMTLDSVAKSFPELTFIMAHNGYPYLMEAWAVAEANDNVYLDIAGSGPWVDGTPVVFNSLGRDSFIPIDRNRILWGTDNCLPPAESLARATAYMRLMGTDKAQRKLIFGGNAERIFKL